MQIYFVRHGIAIDREDPKCPSEPERYLTEEGIEKTKQIAKGMAALGASADHMLRVPMCAQCRQPRFFRIIWTMRSRRSGEPICCFPAPSQQMLFRELAKDKQSSTVFLFGHAPQLDDLIATALGSKHHVTELKKAGVALLELKRISPPKRADCWLSTPKILRRMGK